VIELHGWLTVYGTYEDEDAFPQETLDSIKRKVETIVSESGSDIEIEYRNGIPFINTLLCANHRVKEVDDIIDTYKNIAETAAGSYGIIYLRDDEDSRHSNEFQIFLFRHGECICKPDDNFSPCIPTIEAII